MFCYLLYIAGLILLGIYLVPVQNVLFVWIFFFPTVAYLLGGKRLGACLTFLTLLLLLTVLYIKLIGNHTIDIVNVMVNVISCYLSIWCISHYFELSRSMANDSLEKLAMTDVLTGINNRLAFTKTFTKYQSQYLLMVDLDNFKCINDKYGHDSGDRVLKLIAHSLSTEVGAKNIFRLGGEEFCIWFAAKDTNHAQAYANQLREQIADLDFQVNSEQVRLSFSGGLVKHIPGSTQSGLLSQADNLLYKAKDAGKNKIIF
ncbi:GGDEF domain-containing protein [Shewanella olleyana]|nr:GGDEF domain-containing protein [Shewanella olleyana]